MKKKATTLALVLLSAVLVGCAAEPDKTPGRALYTDREVEAFIEQYPGLASGLESDRPPENVLARLGIDTTALTVIETYIGGCISMVVYELSPGYELVVDDNACSGCAVGIRAKSSGLRLTTRQGGPGHPHRRARAAGRGRVEQVTRERA